MIKSELQRGEKIVADEDAVKILKGIRKGSIETLQYLEGDKKEAAERFIFRLNTYLPTEMNADEVNIWVDKNMKAEDFDNFGMAMKFAMAGLPDGTNGKFVAPAVKLLLR